MGVVPQSFLTYCASLLSVAWHILTRQETDKTDWLPTAACHLAEIETSSEGPPVEVMKVEPAPGTECIRT